MTANQNPDFQEYVEVYKSADAYRIAILQTMLNNNNVKHYVHSEQDSSYLNFGYHRLLIDPKHVELFHNFVKKLDE